MPRATTAGLRARLRLLIGDPPKQGDPATFTEDDLEGFLDEARSLIGAQVLQTSPEADGLYRDYWSPAAWWEDGAVLRAGGAILVANPEEPLKGHWRFAAGQAPPVRISGAAFDLYGAAAATLDAWIAKLKLQEYDLSASGDSWKRSQKITNLTKLRDDYAGRSSTAEGAGVGSVPIARHDWRRF